MSRAVLATLLVLALPVGALAQPVSGLYVGAGAGANFLQPEKFEDIQRAPAPGVASVAHFKARFDPGFAGVGSVGWGFGNGFRVEVEGNWRNQQTLRERKYGVMANGFFDFDIGSPYVWPYAGVGAGYAWVDNGPGFNFNTFAYQAIAGVSVPIPWVVGLSATAEYRFESLASRDRSRTTGAVLTATKAYNDLNHTLLVGLRYAFDVPPPPAPAPEAKAAAVPPPPPAAARTYLVFFDWDKSDLTDRARQIIAEAAAAASKVQHTRIDVGGHADTSGTARYNQALSLRRAQIVAAELVRLGVAKTDISVTAFGDTKPLVPTAAGVREPQNRRVEIVLK